MLHRVHSSSRTVSGVIEIALNGGMIAVTFEPEACPRKVCLLSPQDALIVSCLMLRSGTLRETTNIEVAETALLVEGGRRSQGWFTAMRESKPHLTARLNSTSVREAGRHIHDLYLRAIDATTEGTEHSIFVRQVAYCGAGV